MLHVRPMVPAEPEMVPEDSIEFYQLHDEKGKPLDEWVHWDPATGKPFKSGKPKSKKMIPTGSMKAVDLHCHDCGATLNGGSDYPFYYLACGRIDTRIPVRIQVKRRNDAGAIESVSETIADPPEPKPDSVIECGGYGLNADV